MGYFVGKQMMCYQVQSLMDLYIGNDPSLTLEKRKGFEAHLHNCQECTRKHEENQWIIGLIKESWPYEEENQAFLERINQPDQSEEAIDQCWQELKCRIPKFSEAEKQRKYLPLFRRIAAVAACLTISASLFLAFLIYLRPKTTPKPTHQQVALTLKPSVRIELISDNGSTLIPASQQIVSHDELTKLLINGKHRMMINTNTSLSIEPLVQNSNTGCFVKLVSGQIYTHVKHEGNPFVIDTAHGKAAITGTTFDVKVTERSTTLVVVEGNVQFESEQGSVRVVAGQTSKIVDQAAPSSPASCNASELTAWAAGYEVKPELAEDESPYRAREVQWPWPVKTEPIALEELDYDDWLKEKQNWFKSQFPWIFQLQNALAKEGIEIDYPKILIQSGDIRQFAYPGASPSRIPTLGLNSLLRTAAAYGFTKPWLLQGVDAARAAESAPTPKERFTGLTAFHKWTENLNEAFSADQEQDSDILSYSLRAATYLANTRTLQWFAVNTGQVTVAPEDRDRLLALLQSQVQTANTLAGNIIQVLWTSHDRPCERYSKLSEDITDDITVIITAEEEILQYEQSK